MEMVINGQTAYAATGGRAHGAGMPLAVFIHGAGFDHTAWALQSRWLAFRGWNVLAVDLPGHGRSAGPALDSIDGMAQWVLALIAASGAEQVALIGHSMGSLIALEAAALAPQRVQRLLLVGAAAAMPVHPDLLAAAQANHPDAIAMVNIWGHGYRAGLGGSAAPGLWMTGSGARILARAQPGVLHRDLAACNAYSGALTAAAKIKSSTLILAGERDQMTPLKGARQLTSAIANARLVTVPAAGHMLMVESPDELLAAMRSLLLD